MKPNGGRVNVIDLIISADTMVPAEHHRGPPEVTVFIFEGGGNTLSQFEVVRGMAIPQALIHGCLELTAELVGLAP
ncbi:hypothetical protein BV898_08565 [Hypsibius exemplaris]|uniref:Uncharacterized protein n=1 Tax=Hypsibius exemplaris TaxID=2072580 RepID=A0A1W0WQ35_HYPEX|nr:hypothetical protein BV898_08565 [Hypsibius exemplaris]